MNTLSNDWSFVIIEQEVHKMSLRKSLQDLGFSQISVWTDSQLALDHLFTVFKSPPKKTFLFLNFQTYPVDGIDILQTLLDWKVLDELHIVLTANQLLKEYVTFSAELGVYDFLVHPFLLKDLGQTIHQCVQRKSQSDGFEKRLADVEVLLSQGNLDMVKQELERIKEKFGSKMRLFTLEAYYYELRGDYEKAEEILLNAIESNPMFIKSYFQLGRIYAKSFRIKEAYQTFLKGIELSPRNPYHYMNAVSVFKESQSLDLSIKILETALKNEVFHGEIFRLLGTLFFEQNKWEKALEYYKRAYQKFPEDIVLLNNIGITLKSMGAYDDAIGYYNRAIKLAPGDHRLRYNKALCLIQMKRYQEAKNILTELVRNYPDFPKYQEIYKKVVSVLGAHL